MFKSLTIAISPHLSNILYQIESTWFGEAKFVYHDFDGKKK